MGRDVGKLDTENLVVSCHHVIEPMLPVHGHQGEPFLVQEQKSAVTVHNALHPWLLPILQDCLETFCYILRDGKTPRPGMSLGGLNDEAHVRTSLKLMIDVHHPFFQIDVPDGQPAEFRNSHTRVEENIYHLVVFAVYVIISIHNDITDEFSTLCTLVSLLYKVW